MEATVISTRYVPGDFAITNGHKGHERNHYRDGKYVCPTGYGWGREYKPSKITVTVRTDSGNAEVWVDQYFKNNLGRLTTKRVNAILETAPNVIEVVECAGASGFNYYSAAGRSLYDWLKKAEEKL